MDLLGKRGTSIKLSAEEEARFLSHTSRQPNGCLLWTGGRIPPPHMGYGIFWLRGRSRRAHRVAYMHWCGSIPEGLDVLHRCDNPACVEPSCFFLGTDQDNADDKVQKGRQARGDLHSKLTDEQVEAIRREFAEGATKRRLARKFHVSDTLVRKIVARKVRAA